MTLGHSHDGAPGWARRLGAACGALAALGLLAVTAIATTNLAARWLGLTAPEWVLPLQSEIVAWSMMAGLVTCVASPSWLINLDVLAFASHRPQARLEAGRHAVCAAVFGSLTYVASTTWWKLFRSGLPSTDIVNLPAWVPASGLVVFFGLAALVEVGRTWTSYSRSA
jgi:TRAP-type C4-dicarboxylate transport system permease small subunit